MRVRGGLIGRTWIAPFVAGSIALTGMPNIASAAPITIGQAGNPTGFACSAGFDWLQPEVFSGNSYVVPAVNGINAWTMTSWTTHGAAGPQQLTMKMFRKVSDPATYQVVAVDGPRPTTAGGTVGNTFPTNLEARAGDVLGLQTGNSITSCLIDAPGERPLVRQGNLSLGESGIFSPGEDPDQRLNIEATLAPSSSGFGRTGVRRNKKKGAAILSFNIPNPGDLSGSGKGAKVSSVAGSSKSVGVGTATLVVRAKGKKRKSLLESGRAKLRVAVTYTPTGGSPKTETVKLKLLKKLKR